MHPTADGRFVHLICVYYTPELLLDLNAPEVLVRGLEDITPVRAQLVCSICNRRGLGCIQCDNRNCSTAYHPYCALRRGYILTSDEKHGHFMYLSYCDVHSKKKEQKEEKVREEGKKKSHSSTSTPDKRRKRMPVKKKKEKKEETLLTFTPQLLMRLSGVEKGDGCETSDLWKMLSYYYVMKPSVSYLLPLTSNLMQYVIANQQLIGSSLSASSTSSTSSTSLPDIWIPAPLLQAARALLGADVRRMDLSAKLQLIRNNPLFVIPALGVQNASLATTERTIMDTPARGVEPQKTSNSLAKRLQQLRFQGFDINDFGDLWEAHKCLLDQSFIQWAQEQDVCTTTRFRPATRADLHWLLQLNTINPTFSCESDYNSTFVEKNEFVVLAERQAPTGAWIPVGMVHYYLMWYYPPTNKQHGSCRAIYVCTLQRVTPETHPSFYNKYGVSSERYTGSMLLCLAFLHGKHAGMVVGFCDSTDNSVTFYTDQFQMKALPRGEGRHYTPMQLSLREFDAWNIIRRHLCKLKY